MKDKKPNKIPTITPERLDYSPVDTTIGNTKEEKHAHAFVKGREPTISLSTRLPVSLHEQLRELSFKSKDTLNQIIVRAIREHLKKINGTDELP